MRHRTERVCEWGGLATSTMNPRHSEDGTWWQDIEILEMLVIQIPDSQSPHRCLKQMHVHEESEACSTYDWTPDWTPDLAIAIPIYRSLHTPERRNPQNVRSEKLHEKQIHKIFLGSGQSNKTSQTGLPGPDRQECQKSVEKVSEHWFWHLFDSFSGPLGLFGTFLTLGAGRPGKTFCETFRGFWSQSASGLLYMAVPIATLTWQGKWRVEALHRTWQARLSFSCWMLMVTRFGDSRAFLHFDQQCANQTHCQKEGFQGVLCFLLTAPFQSCWIKLPHSKSKCAREALQEWTFLSLTFYNAPGLRNADLAGRTREPFTCDRPFQLETPKPLNNWNDLKNDSEVTFWDWPESDSKVTQKWLNLSLNLN